MPYPFANVSWPSRTTPTAQPGDDVEPYGAKMESTHRFAESSGADRVCALTGPPPTASATINPAVVRPTKPMEEPPPQPMFNPFLMRRGCPAKDSNPYVP